MVTFDSQAVSLSRLVAFRGSPPNIHNTLLRQLIPLRKTTYWLHCILFFALRLAEKSKMIIEMQHSNHGCIYGQ
jgi:hypothetical protein